MLGLYKIQQTMVLVFKVATEVEMKGLQRYVTSHTKQPQALSACSKAATTYKTAKSSATWGNPRGCI